VIVDTRSCTVGCDYTGYPQDTSKLKRDLCPLNPHARDSLMDLRERGFTVILFTARRESEREITEKWLKRYDIPYDELVMNKPIACVYIDDLAYRFGTWERTLKGSSGGRSSPKTED